MAERNAGPDSMGMVVIAAPPPVTSSRWVGRGPLRRNLFNSFNWLRKKLFIDYIYFIIFYPPLPTCPPQNDRMQPPLRSPTVARPPLSFPYRFRVNLVGCCMHLLIGGRLKSQRILFYLYFCLKIRWLNRLNGVLPYRYRPARHLSQTYPSDTAAFRLVVVSHH